MIFKNQFKPGIWIKFTLVFNNVIEKKIIYDSGFFLTFVAFFSLNIFGKEIITISQIFLNISHRLIHLCILLK